MIPELFPMLSNTVGNSIIVHEHSVCVFIFRCVRGTHVHVCDKLRYQALPPSLFEAGSLICCLVCQARGF